METDVARLSKYGLHVQVQGRRFVRTTERPGIKKATCAVPALFCACARIRNFPYAKEEKNYNQNEK